MKKVGLINFSDLKITPKRELLFFDKLFIPNFEEEIANSYDKKSKPLSLISDLEFLAKNGFILSNKKEEHNEANSLIKLIEKSPLLPDALVPKWVSGDLMKIIRSITYEEKIHISAEGALKEYKYEVDSNYFGAPPSNYNYYPVHSKSDSIAREQEFIRDYRSMYFGLIFNRISMTYFEGKYSNEMLPIIYDSIPSINNSQSLNENNVMEIILSKIPLPDESTSLEEVIDFKSDEETINRLRQLRLWINKMASNNLNSSHLNEHLETLLYDYEKYMRLQKAKFNVGTIEFIVTTTAEVIENAVKLKLGSLAKSLFKLKYNKIALTEKEMKAPGRDIAFISTAKEKFKKKEN